jgi:hypothetical protein
LGHRPEEGHALARYAKLQQFPAGFARQGERNIWQNQVQFLNAGNFVLNHVATQLIILTPVRVKEGTLRWLHDLDMGQDAAHPISLR